MKNRLRGKERNKENRPAYFQNPEWPMPLAKQNSKALNLEEH